MIILLTKHAFKPLPQEVDILVFDHLVTLVDDTHIADNGQIYEFDYLIAYDQTFITILPNIPFVKDGNVIITNWVGQTSIENIYIGNFDKALDDLWNY